MPLRIPRLIYNSDLDTPNSVAYSFEEVTYTEEDVAKLLEEIDEMLISLYEQHYSLPDKLLCIVSKEDRIAIEWYIANRRRYDRTASTRYTLTSNTLELYTQFGRLIFVEGYVGDPVIAHMP